MKPSFRFKVRNVREFGRVKASESLDGAVDLNGCKPALAVSGFAYAEQPPRVVPARMPTVFSIQALRCGAQVFEAVVVFAAVLVVNLFRWPRPCLQSPCNPMRKQVLAVDRDVPVPYGVDSPCTISCTHDATAAGSPYENPCRRIVEKNFAQVRNGWKHMEIMA